MRLLISALALLTALALPAEAAKAKFWYGQFSFDSKRIVALGPQLNTLSVWEVANPGVRKSFTVDAKQVDKMLVALESNIVALLVQAGGEREFIIIDIETVTEVARYVSKSNWADHNEVYALISKHGEKAYAQNSYLLSVLDLPSGKRKTIDPPGAYSYEVLDEHRGWRAHYKTLQIVDWRTPRRLLEIPYGCDIEVALLSPRSNVAAIVCAHRTVRFFDLVKGKFLAEYQTDQYSNYDFSFLLTSDGQRLIQRWDHGKYRVIDPFRGRIVGTFPMPPDTNRVEAASGNIVLLRHLEDAVHQKENDLRLYDMQTGAFLGKLATD